MIIIHFFHFIASVFVKCFTKEDASFPRFCPVTSETHLDRYLTTVFKSLLIRLVVVEGVCKKDLKFVS